MHEAMRQCPLGVCPWIPRTWVLKTYQYMNIYIATATRLLLLVGSRERLGKSGEQLKICTGDPHLPGNKENWGTLRRSRRTRCPFECSALHMLRTTRCCHGNYCTGTNNRGSSHILIQVKAIHTHNWNYNLENRKRKLSTYSPSFKKCRNFIWMSLPFTTNPTYNHHSFLCSTSKTIFLMRIFAIKI